MKKLLWTICCTVLLVAVTMTLCACDFLTGVLDKAEQVANDILGDEQEETTDPATDEGTGNGTGRTEDKTDVEAKVGDVVLEEGDLSFHFLTLGNKYTGDSTYIKIGDVDILIDAGSRQNSAATIIDYVKGYCTDGKLEYVIATHAHQDHIAGFVGTKATGSLFDAFEIGTIIEFAKTNATSSIYNGYCEARDAAKATGAKVYTALDCYEGKKGAGYGQSQYHRSDPGDYHGAVRGEDDEKNENDHGRQDAQVFETHEPAAAQDGVQGEPGREQIAFGGSCTVARVGRLLPDRLDEQSPPHGDGLEILLPVVLPILIAADCRLHLKGDPLRREPFR